jgi:ribosomal RNA assembly protein
VQVRSKKDYTPFPPLQQPSKVDLQLESGEYFLSREIKEAQAAQERRAAQAAKVSVRKRAREDAFVAPEVWLRLEWAE